MKKFSYFFIVIIIIVLFFGMRAFFLGPDHTGYSAGELLKANPEIDMLKYQSRFYIHIDSSDMLQDNLPQITKGKQLGKVKRQSTNVFFFTNYSATKLTVGTEIYSSVYVESKEPAHLLIVKSDGELKLYEEALEG